MSAHTLCPTCSSPIPAKAKFCSQCGARCDVGDACAPNSREGICASPEQKPSSPSPSSDFRKKDIADAAKVGKSVEALAHPLPTGVGILDGLNPVGCLTGLALGLVLFLVNPLRYPVAIVYYFKADARLKAGDIAEARRLVGQCHVVNGVLYSVFILVWMVVIAIYTKE